MRRVITGCLVASSVALAAPKPDDPKPITWADWVGTYQGPLTWSSCTPAGVKSAALALEISDGVASIDLAPTRPGMPSLSLISDDKGWSGRQGDLAVTLARPKPDAIDIAIDLDSGCTMRGHLTRASVVPACAALTGWGRIEARCTKLPGSAVEDFSKLSSTKWKPADADRCTARAAKLERALVDAGCAPHPDPLIGIRARDCRELGQVAARLSRCGNLPETIKSGILRSAGALSSASQSADRSTLPYVEQQCRDTKASLAAVATRFSCPVN